MEASRGGISGTYRRAESLKRVKSHNERPSPVTPRAILSTPHIDSCTDVETTPSSCDLTRAIPTPMIARCAGYSHWLWRVTSSPRTHCVRSSLLQPDLNLLSPRLPNKATSARPCAAITRSNRPNISQLQVVPYCRGTSFVRWMHLLYLLAGILPWRPLAFTTHPVYPTLGITAQSQGPVFTRGPVITCCGDSSYHLKKRNVPINAKHYEIYHTRPWRSHPSMPLGATQVP